MRTYTVTINVTVTDSHALFEAAVEHYLGDGRHDESDVHRARSEFTDDGFADVDRCLCELLDNFDLIPGAEIEHVESRFDFGTDEDEEEEVQS